jgi:DNA replication protein DnaC
MPTINGIQIPDEAYAFITANAGNVYFLAPPEDGLDCPNCGGIGAIFIQVFNPIAKTKTITTVLNEKGHTVFMPQQTKQWPCPVCTERTVYMVSELIDDSGLLPEERDLNVNFLRGKSGKEPMLDQALRIQENIHNTNGVYTLFGGYGTGKSCTMKALVSAATRAGVKARFRTAEEIVQEMQVIFDPDDDQVQERTKAALITRYMKYSLLCVDEIDRVALTTSGEAFLFELLNRRYDHRASLCTILATNKHPDRLGDQFGYLMDRMRDGVRVPVGGVSLRG